MADRAKEAKAERAVRSNHRKLVGGWNRFGNKAAFYNLSGYEIQSGNASAHENHLHPDWCLNLKSESVVLTSKSMNYIVLTEMRIRSWCQHFRNHKYFNKHRHTAEKITPVIRLDRNHNTSWEPRFRRSFIRSAPTVTRLFQTKRKEFTQKHAYAFWPWSWANKRHCISVQSCFAFILLALSF